MDMLASILCFICYVIMGLCSAVMWRNHRVYAFRMRVLDCEHGLELYSQLPSYNRMVLELWKPLNSYLK